MRLKCRAVDTVSLFVPPDHSETAKSQDKYPDFRNTLYWSGSLKPDNNGRIMTDIWASDYPFTYEINVQGIISGKTLVTAKKIIRLY